MPRAGRNSVIEARRRLDAVAAALAALPRRPDRAHRDQIAALAELAQRHPESAAVQRTLGAALGSPRWLDNVPLAALAEIERLLTEG